jgi:hypothetical protein
MDGFFVAKLKKFANGERTGEENVEVKEKMSKKEKKRNKIEQEAIKKVR